MVRNSYYLRTGLITFLLAFAATIVAGLSLFSLLTRRLRRLRAAVKSFELGDYDKRVTIGGNDELADLGRTFNEMADSVDKSVQQRSDLIANISHDLRSPLTSIRGHLETIILKDDKLSNEERKKYLEISLKNVSNFQKLVEELFELAKLESKEIKVEYEPFQIAELAQDVFMKLQPQAEDSGVEMKILQPDMIPVFNGDIAMMERALTNIIENALSFTPEGGKINLEMSVQNENLLIRIRDTGLGINPEDLPHIFERFYKADKSRDRRSPGTGLGLAITKEIILLHNGKIEAFSKEKEGTLFVITLPF